MDSMDNVRERIEALEQQMRAMGAHTRTVERRLRWWRGIACGVIVLALLGLPLQSGKAQYEDKDLAQRVEDLEYKLQYVTGGENEVVITAANLRIVNGLGATNTTNGVGNLIVGYNESRQELPGCSGSTNPFCTDRRPGSHNVVVGRGQNFSTFGGLAGGERNEISGVFASVSGGQFNTASGDYSSVSGGVNNTASGGNSWVSGGRLNTASGVESSASAGNDNTASGTLSSVTGGQTNTASGFASSISGGGGEPNGGRPNIASGVVSSVTGGAGNTASGRFSSVSGGENNTASGDFSSVSGGTNRSAPGTENWAAGPLFATN